MKFSLTKKPTSSRPALSGGLGHQIATDPFLDWIILLAVALVVALILVGTGVSVYLDSRARLEGPITLTPRAQTLPLDEAVMTKVTQSFAGRAESREKALNSFVAPRDPALP